MAPFIQPSAEKFAEPRGICKDEFCILINKVNTQTRILLYTVFNPFRYRMLLCNYIY